MFCIKLCTFVLWGRQSVIHAFYLIPSSPLKGAIYKVSTYIMTGNCHPTIASILVILIKGENGGGIFLIQYETFTVCIQYWPQRLVAERRKGCRGRLDVNWWSLIGYTNISQVKGEEILHVLTLESSFQGGGMRSEMLSRSKLWVEVIPESISTDTYLNSITLDLSFLHIITECPITALILTEEMYIPPCGDLMTALQPTASRHQG